MELPEFPEGHWRLRQMREQNLLTFCMEREWEMVVDMWDTYPILQYASLTALKETALHIAVSESPEYIVRRLVESIKQSDRERTLRMQNDRGNTPLHQAALVGNVGKCMCIAEKDKQLVHFRNNSGETPLFLAALHGKKDAFQYLDQISYPQNHRRSDGDTTLHAAITGEYFDLAHQIIWKYDKFSDTVNEKGYTPLHLLASKPAVFSSHLDGFMHRIIYHCLHVKKLKVQPICTDMHKHFSGEPEKEIEKYPRNYKTCINFFQTVLKMLQNMIKRAVTCGENSSTSERHMQASDAANYCEDPEERHDDTRRNQGNRLSNTEAEERSQLLPPNYHTSIMIIKSICRAILAILKLIKLRNIGKEIKRLEAKKEKNIWSVQIMNLMLRQYSINNYDTSSIGCDPGPTMDLSDRPELKDEVKPNIQEKKGKNICSCQIMDLMFHKCSHHNYDSSSSGCDPWLMQDLIDMFKLKYREEGECMVKETSVRGRETPILLAAKNGITEMVVRILEVFPMAILDRDSVGKNIVLLAVENRQTKLYEKLVRKKNSSIESAFGAVDNKGNSVLHLAATLGDYQPYPLAAMQMQWEMKWYKYVKYFVPRDLFMILNTSLNKENMTPKEVFRKSHENLVKEGGDWLITTSNLCSVVATVVTTLAFATTASVPGGMKEGSSRPNLERHPGFIVFAISSLIALSFSVTSVIAFLSILTPRRGRKDLEKELPKKLLYGLTFLFISLAAMLVCFCAGHFFLMRDNLEHNAFLVYGIACLPVAYFIMKQFPFYIDLLHDTFSDAPRHKPSS